MRDVTSWDREQENTGSREGWWVRDLENRDGPNALIKFPKVYTSTGATTGEVWAEYIASRVGLSLELPMPVVEIVTYDGRIAAMIHSFKPPDDDLREGSQLFGSSGHTRLTPQQVRDTLARGVGDVEATGRVVEMICFDILVANSDRHHQNWGLIIPLGKGVPEVAPLYDNGASLGSGLGIERLQRILATGWEVFDHGFRYEMCDDAGERLHIPELLDLALAWDPSMAGLGTKLPTLTNSTIRRLVEDVPQTVMGDEERDFVKSLLAHRRDVLLDFISEKGVPND